MNQGVFGFPVRAGSTGIPTVVLRAEFASGTQGGTNVAGAWTRRVLNTKAVDTDNICVLSGDQFTLPAGAFEIAAVAQFAYAEQVQLRLIDAVTSAVLLLGGNARGGSGYGNDCQAPLIGRFVLPAAQLLEIQYRALTAGGTVGLGWAASWGVEVYTQAMIRKVG